MKISLEQNLKEAPLVDLDAINKQKRLAKAIIDEDRGLNSFGIAKKIREIIPEQQKKNKTRKQSQQEKEEEEMIAREHKTKKRHEQKNVSSHVCLVAKT